MVVSCFAGMAQSLRSDSLYMAGKALYDKGNYKAALPLFKELVNLDAREEGTEECELVGLSKSWLASCQYHCRTTKSAKCDTLYLFTAVNSRQSWRACRGDSGTCFAARQEGKHSLSFLEKVSVG